MTRNESSRSRTKSIVALFGLVQQAFIAKTKWRSVDPVEIGRAQHWGRDRPENGIELEFLVQRQARDTARTVGLRDRGVLAPGYRGDLNVIDFDNLRVRGPELAYDLPAEGRRVLQRADGYLHIVVGGEEAYASGEETYASGEATGALPGRLVRGEQAAPAMARPHMATGGATNGKGR